MAESQTTTEPTLEPCPFCGGKAAWGEGEQKTKYGNEQVYCTDCWAITAPEGTKDEAAENWNSRVSAEVAPAVDEIGSDTNFPLSETLRLLVEWAQHLHVSHECDCDGWEQRSFLIEAAQRYRNEITQRAAAPASTIAPQEQSEHKRESLLSSEVAWKIARHIAGKNSDYFSMREGLAELESIINLHFVAVAASPAALRDEAEAERLRIIAYLSYDTIYTDNFCVRCKYEPTNCECAAPVYMEGFEPDEKLKALKVALFQEQRPRAVFDAGFATTPPSTAAKAAAEEIDNRYRTLSSDIHVRRGQIAAIIERCLAGGGE